MPEAGPATHPSDDDWFPQSPKRQKMGNPLIPRLALPPSLAVMTPSCKDDMFRWTAPTATILGPVTVYTMYLFDLHALLCVPLRARLVYRPSLAERRTGS